MKRLLIVLCVAALLATIPLVRIATAKTNKEWICHVTYVADDDGVLIAFGRMMYLPAGALAGHEAHGDSKNFVDMTKIEGSRIFWETKLGIDLRNANAYIFDY